MTDYHILRKEGFTSDPEQLLVNETLFHNANGYLGVRSNFEEGYPAGVSTIRGTYINAFYDITPMPQAEILYGFPTKKETIVNLCDTQTIVLELDGEHFSLFEGETLAFARELDMQRGLTKRTLTWRSPGGKITDIIFTRMASFAILPLFTIRFTITPRNWSGDIWVASTHSGAVRNNANENDPRVGDNHAQMMFTDRIEEKDGISFLSAHTGRSGLRLVSAVAHRAPEGAKRIGEKDKEEFRMRFKVHAEKGCTLCFEKLSVLCDSRRYDDPLRSAQEVMAEAIAVPLDVWYARQEEYLARFWEQADVSITGDERLSQSVWFSLYELLQSVGKDAFSSVAAKGLSGEGYEGHFFWDTEMYVLPLFSLIIPGIARSLLSFRWNLLPAARKHARTMGHASGALYPWRTIAGPECSGHYPSGSAQYHLNADIAYAIIQYYLLTEDMDFLAEKGAEILFETARLWLDAGNWHEGSFRIPCVTGPDEYTFIVNNNYYTNVCAQYNLQWAVKVYALLEEAGKLKRVACKIGLRAEEIDAFGKAANDMLLLYDPQLGINPQDDTFLSKPVWDIPATPKENFPLLLHYHPLYINRYQVCKQADTILSHFVHEDCQSEETMRRSYDYYEKITTHDSSLSTCIFSIMAARLGDADKAYCYFSISSMLDIDNIHHNTRDGIHTANMGGTYMGIVYGFAGLRIKEDGLWFRPCIPAAWRAYRFSILYKGSRIEIEVDQKRAVFRLRSGVPRMIIVFSQPMELKSKTVIVLPEKEQLS